MKGVLPIAITVVSLFLGIIIGRKTTSNASPPTDSSAASKSSDRKNYRKSRKSSERGRSANTHNNSQASASNHSKTLVQHANDLDMEHGMPNFDALFGIWELSGTMTTTEIQQALADSSTQNLRQESQMFMKAMLIMQWAKKDGPAAMDFALSEKKGQRRGFPAKEMALQAWASTDPLGARAWYEKNKESLKPREQKGFEAASLAALAKDNFDLAFSKAKNVSSASRDQVLRTMANTVANNPQQREKFTAYLLTLDDEKTRNNAAENIAESLAQSNPQEAVDFVDQWPGEDKSKLANEVAEAWGQTNPKEAIAWRLDNLGTNEDADNAIDDIFGNWARQDQQAAQTWIDAQNDIKKDALYSKASRSMMWDEDYTGAAHWAASIEDEKQRARKYKDIYRQWNRNDKEGAEKWLSQQDADVLEVVRPPEQKNNQ